MLSVGRASKLVSEAAVLTLVASEAASNVSVLTVEAGEIMVLRSVGSSCGFDESAAFIACMGASTAIEADILS